MRAPPRAMVTALAGPLTGPTSVASHSAARHCRCQRRTSSRSVRRRWQSCRRSSTGSDCPLRSEPSERHVRSPTQSRSVRGARCVGTRLRAGPSKGLCLAGADREATWPRRARATAAAGGAGRCTGWWSGWERAGQAASVERARSSDRFRGQRLRETRAPQPCSIQLALAQRAVRSGHDEAFGPEQPGVSGTPELCLD